MYIDKYTRLVQNKIKQMRQQPQSDDPGFFDDHDPEFEFWHWVYDAVITGLFLILLIVLFIYAYSRPPSHFPDNKVIEVPEGSSLSQVASIFKAEHVIGSELIFKVTLLLSGDSRSLVAGDYYFEEPRDLFGVAETVAKGRFGLTPFSVTIPEGVSVPEMAELLEQEIEHDFDEERFITLASPFEGYLFPDTYFFLPETKEEEIVERMRQNFVEQVSSLGKTIKAFGRPLDEVIIMASLVEREAWDYEDRRKIAGVLWNRLEIDMPLQVDAVFPYIIGKNTYQLTLEDLGYDSPQNTYKYPGLPVQPIVSPGLEAIEASVTPFESDYLFYLADDEGVTHFAETFEGHKLNRKRYGL